jgi:phosphoglycolate phosphatase-like HAD superfamily hydrolase
MNLILEIDGVLLDVAPAWYRVHREVAAELGWSTLDQGTFWRQTRKYGREMSPLRGARPAKVKEYYTRLDERLETDEVILDCRLHDGADFILASLSAKASICLVTLGSNLEARRGVLERGNLLRFATRIERLDPDPRRRPNELRTLSGGDRRTLLAAASDAVIRAGGEAGIVSVGIPRGPCSADRLFRAGADIMYKSLAELRDAIVGGSEELIRAGLLPPAAG